VEDTCILESYVAELLRKKAFRVLYVGILKAEMLQWAGSAEMN